MRTYFFGRYFKCAGADGTVAVIPAFHKHGKKKSASLQVITDKCARNAVFPIGEYKDLCDGFGVRLGKSTFEKSGLRLEVSAPGLEVSGELSFGGFTPLEGDIMGPFRFLPFMQCRHSVYSVKHTVTGEISVNGERYVFDGDPGYIEGDRGWSFPKEYLWTQAFPRGGSVMLSVAHIPIGPLHFTGIIGFVYVGGKEYRIATYRGAKVEKNANGEAVIRQKDMTLTVRLLEKSAHPLFAPQSGEMTRTIRESPSCRAYYEFTVGDKTLLREEVEDASFEYEYAE